MDLKERLKALRDAKEMTVAELAKASGVSPPYIWQIENGTKKNPSGEVLVKLAAGLGTTVADLLGSSLVIGEDALRKLPASLKRLVKGKAKQLDIRQEDIEMLKSIHFRGRRPTKEEDWELIFLFLKRILG